MHQVYDEGAPIPEEFDGDQDQSSHALSEEESHSHDYEERNEAALVEKTLSKYVSSDNLQIPMTDNEQSESETSAIRMSFTAGDSGSKRLSQSASPSPQRISMVKHKSAVEQQRRLSAI